MYEPSLTFKWAEKEWSPNIMYPRYYPPAEYKPCAIEEFFKRNPTATSVMMVCNCPRCTPMC